MVKYLIHFWVNFYIRCEIWFNSIYLHEGIQFSQHHLTKRMSFPHCTFLGPSLKSSWVYMGEFESLLYKTGFIKSFSLVWLFSNPGTTVHGIIAITLELVAFSFSRGSSQPRDWTQVSHITCLFFTSWATREAYTSIILFLIAIDL